MSTLFQDDQRERFELNPSANPAVNVSDQERHLSLLIGGALVGLGLGRGSVVRGLMLAGIGAAFVHRGMSGQCQLYKALGINAAASDSKISPMNECSESTDASDSLPSSEVESEMERSLPESKREAMQMGN